MPEEKSKLTDEQVKDVVNKFIIRFNSILLTKK